MGGNRVSAARVGAAIAACLLLSSAHPMPDVPDAYPQDWAVRDLSYFGDGDQWAQTRAICAAVTAARPPASDLPSRADRGALEDCNSADLYYGIGTEADPVAARKCAFLEVERNIAQSGEDFATPFEYFDAHGMLAMVYANGKGATRNLDFAIHAACQIEDAPMAMVGRIEHLDHIRREGGDGEDFSICDDITSGFSGGVCAIVAARLEEQERARDLAAWTADWPSRQREAFTAALDSFEDYADVSNAMNCFRGTLAAACAIGGTQRDIGEFLARLQAVVERRSVPRIEPVEEGDVTAGGGLRPAVATQAEFDASLAHMQKEERVWYNRNRDQAIAARRLFEPKLIAFLKLARPDLTAHEVRVLFRDL